MKTITLASLLILTMNQTTGHAASGSSVGNGFTTESYLKAASLTKSKSPEKLCLDGEGVVSKVDGIEVCKIKDASIKMKDLLEAAKKNDSATIREGK